MPQYFYPSPLRHLRLREVLFLNFFVSAVVVGEHTDEKLGNIIMKKKNDIPVPTMKAYIDLYAGHCKRDTQR